jgi:hypothetical protein
MTKNGIPVDMPWQRKKTAKISTSKHLHNDFNKFNKYATMVGFEDGYAVTVVVPMGHKDFKLLQRQGFKIVDVWEKREIA